MLSNATKPRSITIPDHQALVDAVHLEIKIMTTKMAIGASAVWTDQPLGVCAGMKDGKWKVILFRLPHRCDAEKAISDLYGRFPLVSHTTWGTPSHHVAWQLLQTVGSDLDKTIASHYAADEWKDRFTTSEHPAHTRRQLEAQRAVPRKRTTQEA